MFIWCFVVLYIKTKQNKKGKRDQSRYSDDIFVLFSSSNLIWFIKDPPCMTNCVCICLCMFIFEKKKKIHKFNTYIYLRIYDNTTNSICPEFMRKNWICLLVYNKYNTYDKCWLAELKLKKIIYLNIYFFVFFCLCECVCVCVYFNL